MPGPQMTIRKARPAENELLAEFGARLFAEHFASQNTPENMTAYLAESFNPARQAAELADPDGVFLLAEVDGELAGYAHLHAGPPTLEAGDLAQDLPEAQCPIELVRIYADTPWIGQGVGAALIQAGLDEAQNRGCDLIWLGVWERNPRAQAFYRKWGFEKIGIHTFKLGADLQTDWVMAKNIT